MSLATTFTEYLMLGQNKSKEHIGSIEEWKAAKATGSGPISRLSAEAISEFEQNAVFKGGVLVSGLIDKIAAELDGDPSSFLALFGADKPVVDWLAHKICRGGNCKSTIQWYLCAYLPDGGCTTGSVT